ncbi:MAG: helix-hairpin-helix domain-containing protein [Aigarchaeota archaeon]|nr:helix-hairpin-helix domain-containing protein [Aigarchaeota archaeon]MCX8193618.1 helix-hairpin-helix domain-containing protein [Nitrososphaeria archaeon]MDW7987018.1 ERCC4 domain-containing protein [Nitrososphaerota archaeon]
MEKWRIIKSGTVIVDKREEKSNIPSLLVKHGVSVRFEVLEVGDYALPGEIVIERKTVNDFISSILDGRLFDQALNLSQVSPHPTFIIEGEVRNGLRFFKNENAFWGALASLIYDFKISTLFTSSPEDTAKLISVISKRGEERKEIWVKPKKKKLEVSELQISVLTSLPGVGAVTAQRLLKGLGSLREIFNADPNILSAVGKIPYKKSVEIHQLINTKYSEYEGVEQSKINGF